MPATLSKEEASAKQRTVFYIVVSIFFSVLQHCIQSNAEPLLIRRLVNGDPVATAKILANTSGAIGLLGLFINQIGGKLSDVIGRKPGFLVGPLFSILTGLAVHQFPRNYSVVVGARVCRILFTGFSSSVMCTAALTDVVSGDELSAAFSNFGASVGLSVVLAQLMEGVILHRTNMDIKKPALALSAIGAAHALFTYMLLPETNLEADNSMPLAQILSSLDLSGFNPLSFLQLFSNDKGLELAKHKSPSSKPVQAAVENRRITQKLVVVASFQSFLEGKSVTDIAQVWQREHLEWSPFDMRDFGITYGILCFLAGKYVTPALLRKFSPRTFTSITNTTNFFGFWLRGAAESGWAFWGAVPLMLAGVNGAAGHAIKSIATERAIASGIGRGELSAWFNNLRAFTYATAPVLYGQFYAYAVDNGIYPGTVFLIAGTIGALIPELMLRSMRGEEIENMNEEEKRLVEEGRRLAVEAGVEAEVEATGSTKHN
jgi:hypothetical protein